MAGIDDFELAMVSLRGYCELAQETLLDLKKTFEESIVKLEKTRDELIDGVTMGSDFAEMLAEGLAEEFEKPEE